MVRESIYYFPNILHSGAETGFPHRLGRDPTSAIFENAVSRPRATDDFATLRARMEELRRECEGTRVADNFTTIRARMEQLRREREWAKHSDQEAQRNPPTQRGGATRWASSKIRAGPGRVPDLALVREEGREVLAHWRASAASAVIWSTPSSAK